MSYSSEVLADSPLVYLRLGESSGSTLADSSGNGRNGTILSGVTLGAASLLPSDSGNTCATFSSGYASVANASWMSTATWSVEAWFKPSSVSGSRTIVSRYTPAGTDGVFHLRQDGTALNCYGFTISGGLVTLAATGVTLAVGTTYHVVVTYDSSANSFKIYVDGALKNTVTPGFALQGTSNTNPLGVGRSNNVSFPEYFAGDIDEVALYGTVLSAARVTAHYDAGTSSATTGSGAGSFQWAGVAVGKRAPRGSATGSFAWAGTAAGRSARSGSGAGLFQWAGAAAGVAPTVGAPGSGVGVGAFQWAGAALGVTSREGSAAGSFQWVGAAHGTSTDAGFIPLDVGVDLLVLSSESQEPAVITDMVLLDATVDVLVKHQLTPAAPPLGVLNEWPVRRNAHLMPALSAASPRYRPGDYTVERADAGRFHVFVDGRDVTYLRDSPLVFRDATESVQVGPVSASLSVPQMRPWDEPGVGDLAMFAPDNDPRVEVVFVRTDGTIEHRFDGALATDEDSSGAGSESCTFQAEGALLQAAHENYDPPIFLNATDPGWLVADVLNSVTHRRYGKIPRFTTGLTKVTDPGQQGQSKWQRAQDLLSKCIDDNGRQLALVRVGPWEYRLQWKQDTTTADWTVTKGAPGVEVALRVDQSTRRDCIYGRGVDPEGGVWGNYFFPGLDFYRAPRYPMNNTAINLDGLSDGDTDTGNGITLWQRRMRELGYRVTVDGVMNSADVKWVRQIQRKRGITVDGSLGPQTWSATFDRGYQEPHFERVRRPLAGVATVEPFLYNANGSKAGANPADNPKRIRHAMPEVDFGTGIWKRDAIALAQKMLDRDAVPAT